MQEKCVRRTRLAVVDWAAIRIYAYHERGFCLPNMPITEGSTIRERLPYRTPEVHSFGSIADITAGSGGTGNPFYGGGPGKGGPGPGGGMS
jgi:hypothetical protein